MENLVEIGRCRHILKRSATENWVYRNEGAYLISYSHIFFTLLSVAVTCIIGGGGDGVTEIGVTKLAASIYSVGLGCLVYCSITGRHYTAILFNHFINILLCVPYSCSSTGYTFKWPDIYIGFWFTTAINVAFYKLFRKAQSFYCLIFGGVIYRTILLYVHHA